MSAADGPMLVPVAVYTANLGCAWTRLPDFVSEVEARNGRKAVASVLRDHDIELQTGDMVRGVLYEGKYAVAFSWQKVEDWDQAGRDADYYACAFVPRDLLGKIDFGALLQHAFFAQPVKSPPDRIDCTDMKCGAVPDERGRQALENLRANRCAEPDWAAFGPALSLEGASASRWFVVSVQAANGVSCYSKCDPLNAERPPQTDKVKNRADEAERLQAQMRREGEKLKEDCGRLQAECDRLQAECGRLRTENEILTRKMADVTSAHLKLQGAVRKLEDRRSTAETDATFKIAVAGLLAFALGISLKVIIDRLCK